MAESVSKDQFDEFVKRIEAGFHHMEQRQDDHRAMMELRFDQLNQRFDQINGRFDQVDQRFDQVGQRFGQGDQRMDGLDRRMDTLQGSMDRLNTAVQRQMWVLIGAVVVGGIKVLFFS